MRCKRRHRSHCGRTDSKRTPTKGTHPTTSGLTGSGPAEQTGTLTAPTDGTVDAPLGLFSPTSVWNRPLAADASLDPSSATRMAAFFNQIKSEEAAGIGPWINTTSYSTTIYVVGPNQPRVPVILDKTASGQLASVLSSGVPIPAGAKPSAGTDAEMTIYQPSTDSLWEFWVASLQADGWHARWGGAMSHVSASPGYFSNLSWPGLASWDGWFWGASATSLPIAAGTITINDLKSGAINHALAIAVPFPCSGSFTWPAQRTDGSSTAPDCLPEGAHLRLDPTLDLSKLSLPPITRMLAVAAQRYGIIVRDKTNRETTFVAETPTGTNPYIGTGGLFGGLQPWQFLPPFPWSHLQLLKMNLCTARPCAEPS